MEQETRKEPDTFHLGRWFARAFFGVSALLVFLALISYHPEDSHILAGGLGDYAAIHNWVGLFGAHVSQVLIAWIGFAAYPGIVLILLAVGTRSFARRVKTFNWIYLVGLAATIVGMAMFIGIYPDFLAPLAERLNIARTPGGVLGQRLCAPWAVGSPGGWLAYVVNRPGSAIISAAMILTGAATIWYFDWQDRAVRWAAAIRLWWQQEREKADERRQLAAQEREERRKAREEEQRKRRAAARETAAPTPAPAESPPARPSAPVAPTPTRDTGDEERTGGVRRAASAATRKSGKYRLPELSLLDPASGPTGGLDEREIEIKKEILQETLDSFGIDAQVGDATSGPRVTLFEIKPAPGVKVERISSLANNIAMNLKAESLRILTPIPGRDSVGIEVPNSTSLTVPIRELFELPNWKNTRAHIPIAIGKNIAGKSVILDLARAPHLLIAGATGSGKSVCMNALILSLLYRFTPEQLRLIMVDPKVVEFSSYNTLPHLATPVVTDVKKVPLALRWILNQMEWRYKVLSKVGVRNIHAYNSRRPSAEPVFDDDGEPIPEQLPYIVLIIDELADIMMTAKADVETSLARVAQLARAVGIHAVIATQRPSVNIITGVIKANFPTRIAFQVSSVPDSRTILDTKGAESLLGRGDMLFKPPGGSRLERTQGALVADGEIERVVEFASAQRPQEFVENMFATGGAEGAGDAGGAPQMEGDEELIQQAIEIILQDRRATTSHIQRRLRIGYNRAALIIEILEQRGIVGPQIGNAPREILISGNDDDSMDDDTGEADE